MGKRSKKIDTTSEVNELQSVNVDSADAVKTNKSRKRQINNESSDLVNEPEIVENEEPLNNEKKSKAKKKLKDNDKCMTKISEEQKHSHLTSEKSKQINQTEETQVDKTSSKKDKVKNKNVFKQNDQNKNKKIIFEEDTGEPVEVSKNQSHKNESDEIKEEDVKDEDIDQFCDDITEEDNVKFENWVQLIEAKLKSDKPNKKKSKT